MTERQSTPPDTPQRGQLDAEELEQIAGGEDQFDTPSSEPVTPDPWEPNSN